MKELENFISNQIGSKFENIMDSSGNTIKYEVLLDIPFNILREYGFSSIPEFLALCEKEKLLDKITIKHIKNVLKVNEQLKKEDISNMVYSINVSKQDMISSELIEFLIELNNDELSILEFEVLETVDNDFFKCEGLNESESNNLIKFINKIKSSGIKINIDDFGSGFATTEQIKTLLYLFGSTFQSIKFDKDIILFNNLLFKLKDEKKLLKIDNIINKFYMNSSLKLSLTDELKNIISNDINIKPESLITLNALKEIANIQNKSFSTLLNEISQAFNNNGNLDSIIKKLMIVKMKIINNELDLFIKFIETHKHRKYKIICESVESIESIENLFKKVNSLDYYQGYEVFDKENLLKVNNSEINTLNISKNINIHKKKCLNFFNKVNKTNTKKVDFEELFELLFRII